MRGMLARLSARTLPAKQLCCLQATCRQREPTPLRQVRDKPLGLQAGHCIVWPPSPQVSSRKPASRIQATAAQHLDYADRASASHAGVLGLAGFNARSGWVARSGAQLKSGTNSAAVHGSGVGRTRSSHAQ